MCAFDAERVAFVFGPGVGPDVFDELEDPDDVDERVPVYDELFAAGPLGDDSSEAQRAIRQVIANQILDDQPPEVWATAQRLVASGLEREQAMGQLGMVFAATMRDLLADERSFDPEAYAAAMARLPLPEAPVVQQALLGIAGAEPGIALDAWRMGVADALGLDLDDLVVDAMLDSAIDDLLDRARLWQRLEPTPIIEEDLAHLAPFLEPATSSAKAAPGRNDPCWCGSGRKYKQCHLGELPVPSLAERVPWLCRKSVSYITRRLDRTEEDALAVAFARYVADLERPPAPV